MSRSKQQSIFLPITLSLILLIGFGKVSQSQTEDARESQSVSISNTEDGKVKLKVVIKKGNDETTFEKTYDSHEEMENDPDLEKYGINTSFSFRGFGGNNSSQPRFFFHNGPGNGVWDHDFDIDSLRNSIRGMMKGFGPNSFSFGFDDDDFMDMDSLMQKFSFRNNNGSFSFNGKEVTDIDSLRAALKDKFGNMMFDFDFGDNDNQWTNRIRGWGDDDDDVRVISRVSVFIRSAQKEDKEVAGTDKMESLELRDINFYPNPSDGRFDVELETGSDAAIHISVLDPNGNEVYNRTGKPDNGRYDFRVDLSHEEKGIYIMKVVQNNKALTKRVIIE